MSRLEQLGPVWLRWVPRPAIGLPILIGASGAVAAGTLAFGWPLGVLTLVAIPIPFTGIRWSRGPSYAAIAGLLVAGLVTTDVHSNDEAYAFLRTFIQVGVIALLWEATHSASRMGSRAIEALAENEARYRRLAEGSNVIPFEFDLATMRFTYVGPHAEEVLGFPAEAWLGDGFWHDRLHPEDRDAALAFCEAATARGEDHDFDYRMIGSSDQPVWIHDIVSVVKGQGAVRSLRGVMVDITKRKQAEQEHRDLEARMVESQKLESLGLIAGGVAHDFNNLLTAVLGNAALALEDLPPHHPGRERIEDLVTAAERGSELTGQMLTYAGRTSPGTPPRDLSKVTGETVRLLASSISKKARLKIHLEPSIWVQIDSGQLHQVVMNLVTNASDALGDDEGTIQVRTRIEPTNSKPANSDSATTPLACLEVTDDGAGMDDEIRRNMFDPFFTTKFKGRGLGLAAVHGIVRTHGGEIEVDSEPGRGSRVRVLLPCCPAPEQASLPVPDAISTDAPRPAADCTLLVVDDETQVRDVSRMALERKGYRVVEAVNGLVALELLDNETTIEGVVLDLTMPRLSGEETLRALRTDHPKLPVLLISGNASQPLELLDPNGPSDFLQKPFSPGEIVAKMAALLQT